MNYFEYLDKTQDVIDRLEILLMKLDIEIGSTINSNDDANVVLNNMKRANEILQQIKELYNIKFGGNKMKTYTKFDLERLQKEYNNANSKRSEEVILQMIEEVKAEISKGVR